MAQKRDEMLRQRMREKANNSLKDMPLKESVVDTEAINLSTTSNNNQIIADMDFPKVVSVNVVNEKPAIVITEENYPIPPVSLISETEVENTNEERNVIINTNIDKKNRPRKKVEDKVEIRKTVGFNPELNTQIEAYSRELALDFSTTVRLICSRFFKKI